MGIKISTYRLVGRKNLLKRNEGKCIKWEYLAGKWSEIMFRSSSIQAATKNQKRKNNIIKKRQIIRESSYLKLGKDINEQYDVTFTPLTKQYFEKRATFSYMKGKRYLGDQYSHYPYPKEMIKRLTGIHLWDRRYNDWLIRYNENDEMVIKAGLRFPESRLGLAIFRKKSNE